MINISYDLSDVAWTLLLLGGWFLGRPYLKRYLENDVRNHQAELKKQMEEQERIYKEELLKETLKIQELTEEEAKELEEEEKPIQDKKII
ncbi:hypothetical protein K7432_007669 [Basidiobolus ranarum]|uniref:ATP synthase F0 subunit B n=1 Tax=Basidiobolus ranarum TaxID=34480 RepID=A0ABR2WT00_9FUNG